MEGHHDTLQLGNFYNHLKTIAPSAVVLSSVAPLPSASMLPLKRVVRKLPPPLTSLQDHKFTKMTNNELMKASQDVFQELKITPEEAEYLEGVN